MDEAALIDAIEAELLDAIKGSAAEGWMKIEARAIARSAIERYKRVINENQNSPRR